MVVEVEVVVVVTIGESFPISERRVWLLRTYQSAHSSCPDAASERSAATVPSWKAASGCAAFFGSQ